MEKLSSSQIENLRKLDEKQLTIWQELGCMIVILIIAVMGVLFFAGIVLLTNHLSSWIGNL